MSTKSLKSKKMKLSKRKWLFIGISILIGLNSSKLAACSCDPISFDRAIEYADEIFIGTIVKAERFENGNIINYANQEEIIWGWSYHFEVKKKWKGNTQSNLIVFHQGNSCDFFFDIYERGYLVYAAREAGEEHPLGITIGSNNGKERLTTWLCSRTISNNNWDKENWFENDIEKLNAKFPNEIVLSSFQFNKYWLMVFGFVIAGILAWAVQMRRMKKFE